MNDSIKLGTGSLILPTNSGWRIHLMGLINSSSFAFQVVSHGFILIISYINGTLLKVRCSLQQKFSLVDFPGVCDDLPLSKQVVVLKSMKHLNQGIQIFYRVKRSIHGIVGAIELINILTQIKQSTFNHLNRKNDC